MLDEAMPALLRPGAGGVEAPVLRDLPPGVRSTTA